MQNSSSAPNPDLRKQGGPAIDLSSSGGQSLHVTNMSMSKKHSNQRVRDAHHDSAFALILHDQFPDKNCVLDKVVLLVTIF